MTFLLSIAGLDALFATETIDLATDTQHFTIESTRTTDQFGIRVTSCDINGDGIPDLVIGAAQDDGVGYTRFDSGSVWLILGRRGAWRGTSVVSAIALSKIYGADEFDYVGDDVACADLDNDGLGDVIIASTEADGPSNTRPFSGDIHVLRGALGHPAVRDLLIDPGIVIYGQSANDHAGDGLATGDLNADGIADLAIAATSAPQPNGSGRTFVVFGRQSWPDSLDLAVDTNVMIRGRDPGDYLGYPPEIADLTGDGRDDLLVSAHLGDGPGNARFNAGEVYLLAGRAAWPADIDLNVVTPELEVVGADSSDGLGFVSGIEVVDVDLDNTPELWLGASTADGRTETAYSTGELRAIRWPAIQSLVDLRSSTDYLIYGDDAGDRFGKSLRSGRFFPGRSRSLIADSGNADGPSDSRIDSGTAFVFRPRSPLPAVQDNELGAADLMIYGRLPSARLGSRAIGDINGDGFDDMILTEDIDHLTRRSAVLIVSPIDSDGDGWPQLSDNCPLVPNPTQADSNLDARGDACSSDWDGDSIVDAEDCASADAEGGTPGEVQQLAFDPSSKSRLVWAATAFGSRYDITRLVLSAVGPGSYGDCQTDRDPDPTNTSFDDNESAPAGDGLGYLVRARNDVCRIVGGWGTTSSGTVRVNNSGLNCP